jgi:hypothetical protein
MRTARETISVSRQIAFFAPADMRGKWHARFQVTGAAVCGTTSALDADQVIRTRAGQEKVHPIVCRRCLRLTVVPGVSAQGVDR